MPNRLINFRFRLYIILLINVGWSQDCDNPLVHFSIINVDINAGTLDVYLMNSEPVKGFQFELFGMTLTGISGGLAGEYLDYVSYNATTSLILGSSFSSSMIPVGEGVLTQVSFSDYEGGDICFGTDPDNNVFSDALAGAIWTDWGD